MSIVKPLLGPALILAAAPLAGQPDTAAYRPTPLFASDEALRIRLAFDRETVIRDTDSLEREEHPALLNVEGSEVTLEVQVRTRGHFRRQRKICDFPPLRLNVKKKQVVGTVFEGQDKLKLVTHCQPTRDDYAQYVVLEYLTYRILNLLTDHAFRARLVDVTYVDITGREDTLRTVAVVLESEDELAARLGGTVFETGMPAEEMQPDHMALVDVFQYLVGNTDWSVGGLHNMVLLDANFEYYAIPFDFDFTGLVDARYARPDGNLPIDDVRERLYRGACHTPEQFAAVFARFNAEKDAIYALFENPFLDEDTREDSIDYLDEFYETINNDGLARRRLRNRCR